MIQITQCDCWVLICRPLGLQGLKPYRGGEELRRATAALCGSAVQLETVPPVATDPDDFEGIYDQGLALQEAATLTYAGQRHEQQRLLREVRLLLASRGWGAGCCDEA